MNEASKLRMTDTQLILTDQQLTEALLSYRGSNPTLSTIAHGIRLGLGKSTPEDQAHFEAVLSSEPEHVATVMRKCAQGLASEIKKVTAPESGASLG